MLQYLIFFLSLLSQLNSDSKFCLSYSCQKLTYVKSVNTFWLLGACSIEAQLRGQPIIWADQTELLPLLWLYFAQNFLHHIPTAMVSPYSTLILNPVKLLLFTRNLDTPCENIQGLPSGSEPQSGKAVQCHYLFSMPTSLLPALGVVLVPLDLFCLFVCFSIV